MSRSHETSFKPTRILEVNLDDPIDCIETWDSERRKRYERAISLVRLHTQPIGILEFELHEDSLSASDHANLIWSRLGDRINQHLRQDGLPAIDRFTSAGLPYNHMPPCQSKRKGLCENAPLISVVVCTRDRPKVLKNCLDSLLGQEYPNYEVIVVDNAPATDETANLIQRDYGTSSRVRCVREPRPGLSFARNRGLGLANGEITAFTDDDVIADRWWLTELATGFARSPCVGAVTGLTLPVEIETWAQDLFEQYGGFAKGFEPHIIDLRENRPPSPLFPFAPSFFGSGNNMAFRASALRELGGFDPKFGVGAPLRAGEDIAACLDIVMNGCKLAYEPGAIVFHLHRRDIEGLRKQLFGYGVGITAQIMRAVVKYPGLIPALLRAVPRGLWYALSSQSPKNAKRGSQFPRELALAEFKGLVWGPFAYLMSSFSRSESH
jgi:glycosyltransferase involved in cell wall biosynthesis